MENPGGCLGVEVKDDIELDPSNSKYLHAGILVGRMVMEPK